MSQSALYQTLQTSPTSLSQLQDGLNDELMNDVKSAILAVNLPESLSQACLYAMGNGGKRVRPLLVLAGLSVVGVSQRGFELARRAMMAVEMIHGYSLVHDDLPCMDDDDLRRGKPTCHIVYGEAVAMLVGDVLQTLAFEVLCQSDDDNDTAVLTAKLSAILAPRARRMVSGQMLDLLGERQMLDAKQLQAIHIDKTGALIEASVLMGAVCTGANADTMDRLSKYAQAVGLAYQVQDDVLDVVADTSTLGKPAGSDEKLEKSTYVKLLGVEQARHYADELFAQARECVAVFGDDNLLLQVVDWLQKRDY
ncbi:polyprenyl synthetase family protein [Moraxella nasicaprae]